jgi:LysM repeat protein
VLTLFFTMVLGRAARSEAEVHVVQPGETLSQIAVQYGVATVELMTANGIGNPNFVVVGQRLEIPGEPATTPLSLSATQDEAAVSNDKAFGEVTPANNDDTLLPYVPEAPPSPQEYVYVAPGDTLSQIAQRYGLTSAELMALNGLTNQNILVVGQRIRIVNGDNRGLAVRQRLPQWDVSGVHVVQPGETLSQIALNYGVKFSVLLEVNSISYAKWIPVGTELKIPMMPKRTLGALDKSNAPLLGQRLIEVNLTTQTLTAWEGDEAVLHTLISSGAASTPTVTGRYAIRKKLPSQTMEGPGYSLPNVPWVMYFYGAFALHGAYWHNNFGMPMSHGCVNLRNDEAHLLYNWADIGTEIYVHW